MKKHIYDESNGLNYTLHGDCYLPDLAVNEEEPTYGKYGMLRKQFLKEHKPARYQYLLMTGELTAHLNRVDQEARELGKYFIMATAIFMPQNAFLHATYFTLRSGGRTIVTFLFDSVFIWCVSVSIAFTLSRFTTLPVIAIYVMVQLGDIIKCVIGFILVKKGVWLQNIVTSD